MKNITNVRLAGKDRKSLISINHTGIVRLLVSSPDRPEQTIVKVDGNVLGEFWASGPGKVIFEMKSGVLKGFYYYNGTKRYIGSMIYEIPEGYQQIFIDYDEFVDGVSLGFQ